MYWSQFFCLFFVVFFFFFCFTNICDKLLKLCPTLCSSMDCSPPGFSVHGISQARMLEWVALSFAIYIYTSIVLVNFGCHKKYHRLVGFNNTYPCTVLETRSSV